MKVVKTFLRSDDDADDTSTILTYETTGSYNMAKLSYRYLTNNLPNFLKRCYFGAFNQEEEAHCRQRNIP